MYKRYMSQNDITYSRKTDVARRQLGTALYLWLADLDPVSVHALACGGGEIAEALAAKAQGSPLSSFILDESDLTARQLVESRNRLWNAMKHFADKKGNERDDESLLSVSLEEENEARLFQGWFDLSQIGIPQPIEAQVFVTWYLIKLCDRVNWEDWMERLFPGLQSLSSAQQKALLRMTIEKYHANTELINDPRTDRRPLILPA